jgi:hypothetical protein
MMTQNKQLRLDETYSLSSGQEREMASLYEGIAGNKHCFIVKGRTNDSFRRIILGDGEFKVKGTIVRIDSDFHESHDISKELEPIEFNQIGTWWEKKAK